MPTSQYDRHTLNTLYISTVVNHVLAELFVSNESVVGTQEVLLFALLLELTHSANLQVAG